MSDRRSRRPGRDPGQRYPIRSSLDPEYVARLATYVDEKMRAAADTTPSGDSLRLAVLAALNIADELFRCRDATSRPRRRRSPSGPRSSNACSIASCWRPERSRVPRLQLSACTLHPRSVSD